MPSRPSHPRSNGSAAAAHPRRKRAGAGGRAAAERASVPRARTERPVSPRAAADNALAVLRADHERVTELFARFERLKSNGPQKAQLVERICDELELHTRIEEELFYPSIRPSLGDDDLMDEAQVEHDSAKALIEQLRGMKPGDTLYDAKVTVLGEYVRHHVQEEQDEMFPKVEKIDLDLVALGRALEDPQAPAEGRDRTRRASSGSARFPA